MIVPTQGLYPGLILRSVAISAFTRVFGALWQRVSKDGAALVLRDGASRLLRMRAERERGARTTND
jgi:hypothetical protein